MVSIKEHSITEQFKSSVQGGRARTFLAENNHSWHGAPCFQMYNHPIVYWTHYVYAQCACHLTTIGYGIYIALVQPLTCC